jgi:hypothetical protein
MDDLRRFLPAFGPEDVELITYQPHLEQPLFMNDVGGWAFRPEASTQIPNLFVAGDFARSHVDLVSMEGAVSTGLLAAEALRQSLGLGSPIEVLLPPIYPEWLLALGRLALLPAAAAAKVWSALTLAPYDPSLSDIPPFDPESLPDWPLIVLDESAPPPAAAAARHKESGQRGDTAA